MLSQSARITCPWAHIGQTNRTNWWRSRIDRKDGRARFPCERLLANPRTNCLLTAKIMSPNRLLYQTSSEKRTYRLSISLEWNNVSVAPFLSQCLHPLIDAPAMVTCIRPVQIWPIWRTSTARHGAQVAAHPGFLPYSGMYSTTK